MTQPADEATTAAHLTDLAAFVRQQRAQGWREAIAALRRDTEYHDWHSAAGAWQHKPTGEYVSARDRGFLADFLESLAPKETP